MSLIDRYYTVSPSQDFFRVYLSEPCSNYWYIFFGAAFLYLVGVYQLVQYMKTRKPVSVRLLMIVWNSILSLASLAGTIVMVPFLLLSIWEDGMAGTVCSYKWYHYESVCFVVCLFCWSKIPELFDTVLLALRKREIMLLHWYHHVTVLLFVWLGSVRNIGSIGVFFSAMNLTVHTIMYGYFALSAAGIRVPFPMGITILQILQMCVGTWVVVLSVSCSKHPITHWSGLIMYTSYGVLFALFFVERYVLKKETKDSKADDMRLSKDKVY